MKREHFTKVVEEALGSLPQEFRTRIRNVAVLVEDLPPNQPPPKPGQRRRLLLGVFYGEPAITSSECNRNPTAPALGCRQMERALSSLGNSPCVPPTVG
jgi:predicted Zn-dependent protease with MMP-like domain